MPGGVQVAHCADLARVTEVACPVSPTTVEQGLPELGNPQALIEPAPDQGELPIHMILVPTDGSRAAIERVRTVAASAAPYSLARTAADHRASALNHTSAGLDNGLRLATVFVLLVAACSLVVSVAAGLMERRRPFALLRAAGANLGELRWTAQLETGVPLLLTVLGAVGVAMLTTYAVVPSSEEWVLPGGGFFLTLGVGVLAATAVTLITWPLMDAATGHDSVRFE
jgi:predicted lysophospholipase L1 biosynthesis ABC-type transport system permease subunit